VDVLGVQVLFLDTDRNPIKDQKYVFEFAGRVIQGVTGADGLARQIFTDHPTDQVKVLIARLDGSLKEVATIFSGYRNKLVTILSPRYRADGKTELDPGVKPGEVPHATVTRKPVHKPGQRLLATTGKKDLGPQVASAPTADKRPRTEVKGDIAELNLFLDKYDGHKLSPADIKAAAEKLNCPPGMIHAISKQESLTSSFLTIGNRMVPKILYERHLFRKYTAPSKGAQSPYEAKYPDICGDSYHRTRRSRKNESIDLVTGDVALEDDVYGHGGLAQYRRLVKAYQLDPDAALRACSWGKFQILGNNHENAGFKTAGEFVRAMSRNEVEHLKAFLQFAAHNRLLRTGLQQKNFEMVAEGHNGSKWRTTNPQYADNLRTYYKEYNDDQPTS
jgi:hypothetical protein